MRRARPRTMAALLTLVLLMAVGVPAAGQEESHGWRVRLGTLLPVTTFKDDDFERARLRPGLVLGVLLRTSAPGSFTFRANLDLAFGAGPYIRLSDPRCEQWRSGQGSSGSSCSYRRGGAVAGLFAGLQLRRNRISVALDLGPRIAYTGVHSCPLADIPCVASGDFPRSPINLAARPSIAFAAGIFELEVGDWLSRESGRWQHELSISVALR